MLYEGQILTIKPVHRLHTVSCNSMKIRSTSAWLWTAIAFGLGLALRVWFITHSARIAGDTLIYGEIAKNWMQHGIYGFTYKAGGPQPTLIRLPGYPIFLALCFSIFGADSYTAVMYVQAIVDLLSCLLISLLAGQLLGRPARTATIWLACLCPFTASYVANPLTETLTLACIVTSLYAFYRWQQAPTFNRWLWMIALSLAYAIFLRPEQGLLAAAILPAMLYVLFRQHGFAKNGLLAGLPAIAVAICVVLPLLPWTIRNERTFHVFQPLAPRYATDPGETVPLGFQRWYRTWAIDFASTEDVYWNYDGAPIPIADLPTRAFDTDDQYTRTAALLDDYNETSNDTPALEARWNALAAERIHADPLRYYLALPVARLFNMALRPRVEMFPVSLEWWKGYEHPGQTAFAASYAAINFAYLVLAVWGIVLWKRRMWQGNAPLAWAMLATIVMRSVLLLTLDNSEPRYTLEFFPVVFLLAAIPFASRRTRSLS
jgi:4-amino-4-deoxy-L-arabinose transferase-like glycosyltransferase